VQAVLTLFHSDFSHEIIFCGEFLKDSSWEAGVLAVYRAEWLVVKRLSVMYY
jgi:hypothetical protein